MTTAALQAGRPVPPNSDLDTFLIIIGQYAVGTQLTVETIRGDLEAAQISPSSYGGLFGAACRRGELTHTGRSQIERKSSRKGGRASIYKRTQPGPLLAAVQGGGR